MGWLGVAWEGLRRAAEEQMPKVLWTGPHGGQNRLGLPQLQTTAYGVPRPVPRGCLDEEPRKD